MGSDKSFRGTELVVVRISRRIFRGKNLELATLLPLIILIIVAAKFIWQKKPETIVISTYEKKDVVVPISRIPIGARINESQFKKVSFPADSLPEGVVDSLQEYRDYIFSEPIPAGVPFTKESLKNANTLNPVIESIPSGMRAITLKVDVISSIEGWAQSGTFVDVLLTDKSNTSVIAEKIKIISVERKINVEHIDSPSVPSSITLLVDQDQCLAINLAMSKGKISFALRNNQDSEFWVRKNLPFDSLGRRSSSSSSQGVFYLDGKVHSKLVDGTWIRTK